MRRAILALVLLLTTTVASAQVSAITAREIQAAAAFTDGFIVDCYMPPDPLIYQVCVNTSHTPWDAIDLMDWADYGLSLWTIDRAWSFNALDEWYDLQLYRHDRREMILITVFEDGDYVTYHAMRY